MGNSHSVTPLLDDPTFAPWLAEHGIVLPQPWPPSRYPTPHELRLVLDQEPGYQVRYIVGPHTWDAQITTADGMDTTIWVRDFVGDETVPLPFFFHKGWFEVNLWILLQLTPTCGPLVIVDHAEALPLLVMPDQSITYGHYPSEEPSP